MTADATTAPPVDPSKGDGEAAPAVLDPMPNGDVLPSLGQPAVAVDGEVERWRGEGTLTRLRETDRRAIFPAWLKDGREAASLAKFLAGYGGHIVSFHAVRTPKYAGIMVWYSIPGLVKIARATGSFMLDLKTQALLDEVHLKRDTKEYRELERVRARHVRKRATAVTVGFAAFLIGAAGAWILSPVWLQAAALGGVVIALGNKGRPADRPIIAGATVATYYAVPLKSDIVLRGLRATAIKGIATKDARIDFVTPITRDGPGWRAELDLPYGVTAGDVMEKREELSSGLRRPLGCVWPEGDPRQHEGRLILWVGDRDLARTTQPAWPLLTSGPIDIFEPQPFGTDQRGRWIRQVFMFTSGAIGSIPRMGKTFALREIALIHALDPRCRLYLYDLKGTGDFDPLAPCAFALRAGDDEVRAIVDDLRELREDMRRRVKVIRSLPRDICPENKVTSQLASRPALGLHPVFVGIDECQILFEHPEIGKEAEEIVTDLVKRGPATGIEVYCATQRPDAKSLPPGISDNVMFRFCLKVMGYLANDMVLGTSSYQAGHRATTFAFSDKGIGLLKGEGEAPTITRTVYLDGPAAEELAVKARAFREAAGLLDGMAAGERLPDVPTWSFEDDLLTVWATVVEGEKVWSETLLEHLRELRPGAYDTWDADRFAAALPAKLSTRQIWGKLPDGSGANRRGLVRGEVLAVLGTRRLELGGPV